MDSDKKDVIKNTALLKQVLAYFAPYWPSITLAVICMFLVAGASAGIAFLSKPAWDEIFVTQDRQALIVYPLLFVVAFFIKGFFRYGQSYLMRWCGVRVLQCLRNELYEKIIRLPLGFFDSSQVGMLHSRIVMDVNAIGNSLPALVTLSRSVLEVIGYIGVAFYMAPGLASIAIFIFPLAAFPVFYFGKRLRAVSRRNQSKISDVSVVLNETFSGVHVIKAFATEDYESKRFQVENEKLTKIARKGIIFHEMSSPVMDIIGALGIAFVMWYCGGLVMGGELTQGQFISFIFAAGLTYSPIKKINSANLGIQRALAGAERVFALLHSADIAVEKQGETDFEQPFQELVLENVNFHYPGTDTLALKDINLTIKAGERVALVGPSGAGKSTLARLVPRFYEVEEGSISINNKPLAAYTLTGLRRHIGIVSQDAFLFNLSVKDNISYGQENAADQDIIAAAKAAYAHDFIKEMDEGYATLVGEQGVKLSGGQKQRITIARALFKNPSLLILDEATSALDTESESKVQAALDNLMKNRTSIVIAHRLSTIVHADKIVVMQQGEIVTMGTHRELLENCDIYKRLHAIQFQAQETAKP